MHIADSILCCPQAEGLAFALLCSLETIITDVPDPTSEEQLTLRSRLVVPHTVVCFAGASLVPSSIFLNGEKCILVNIGGQALGVGINGTAGQESAEQPLSLSGPNIIGTDGNVVNFQGVNWFGFEVPTIPRHENQLDAAMLVMLSGFAADAGRSDHAGRDVGQR